MEGEKISDLKPRNMSLFNCHNIYKNVNECINNANYISNDIERKNQVKINELKAYSDSLSPANRKETIPNQTRISRYFEHLKNPVERALDDFEKKIIENNESDR